VDSQQSIFLILGAFYLYESVLWLPRSSVAFMSGWGRKLKLRHPGNRTGNQRGALTPKPWLPPGRQTFLAAQAPFALSPEGIVHRPVAKVSPGEPVETSGECLKWDEVESIEAAGKWVRLNGRRWWKTPSLHNAKEYATTLGKIRDQPESGRTQSIRQWLGATLDATAVTKKLTKLRGQTRNIGWIGTLLFLFLFLILLPMSFIYSYRELWGGIIGVTLLQTIPITFIFRRAHRELYPAADDERFAAWLTMLLFAPAAIRAQDLLTQPLLYRFHPLAVAMANADETSARRYAVFILRELCHAPTAANPDPANPAGRIESWHREQLTEAVQRRCEKAGWKVADLLRPPARIDPEAKSHCPRCLAEFVITDGMCPDCGAVPLRKFEPSPD
jgi:hypothetical protein